jgi:hypothetical protein
VGFVGMMSGVFGEEVENIRRIRRCWVETPSDFLTVRVAGMFMLGGLWI